MAPVTGWGHRDADLDADHRPRALVEPCPLGGRHGGNGAAAWECLSRRLDEARCRSCGEPVWDGTTVAAVASGPA